MRNEISASKLRSAKWLYKQPQFHRLLAGKIVKTWLHCEKHNSNEGCPRAPPIECPSRCAFRGKIRELRRTTVIRVVTPDSATLGEVTDTPAVIRSFAGRMDGCLDFYLLELPRGFFVFQSLTASQFDRALQEHFAYFDSLLVLPSFLDKHDMNRFVWLVDGDRRRLRLAALC